MINNNTNSSSANSINDNNDNNNNYNDNNSNNNTDIHNSYIITKITIMITIIKVMLKTKIIKSNSKAEFL